MILIAIASMAALGLAGCSPAMNSGGSSSGSKSNSGTPSAAPAKPSQTAELTTATTSLGAVVVNDKGMTVYFFDKDTKNEASSACTGQCISAWPAVTTLSSKPTVTGVTGPIGMITTAHGAKQITISGLPIYTFSGDSAPGDMKGQGLHGVWWAVSPSGSKVTGNTGGN
ncbi:MAG: hypothetical protein ABI305_03720 [Tepidiformaceae bacterium]